MSTEQKKVTKADVFHCPCTYTNRIPAESIIVGSCASPGLSAPVGHLLSLACVQKNPHVFFFNHLTADEWRDGWRAFLEFGRGSLWGWGRGVLGGLNSFGTIFEGALKTIQATRNLGGQALCCCGKIPGWLVLNQPCLLLDFFSE